MRSSVPRDRKRLFMMLLVKDGDDRVDSVLLRSAETKLSTSYKFCSKEEGKTSFFFGLVMLIVPSWICLQGKKKRFIWGFSIPFTFHKGTIVKPSLITSQMKLYWRDWAQMWCRDKHNLLYHKTVWSAFVFAFLEILWVTVKYLTASGLKQVFL